MDLDKYVPDTVIDDMMEVGGYGITYWSRQATREEFARYPDSDFLIVESYDDEEFYPLSYQDIREAYGKLVDIDQRFVNREIHNYFLDSWRDRTDIIDAGHIDATAGDVLIQVACFGELVYG